MVADRWPRVVQVGLDSEEITEGYNEKEEKMGQKTDEGG